MLMLASDPPYGSGVISGLEDRSRFCSGHGRGIADRSFTLSPAPQNLQARCTLSKVLPNVQSRSHCMHVNYDNGLRQAGRNRLPRVAPAPALLLPVEDGWISRPTDGIPLIQKVIWCWLESQNIASRT